MGGSVLEAKSSFKILGLSFSSKLDWCSFIISIAKTNSDCEEIGGLICSMKLLSPEVVLYLYKSTIQRCMEYDCHVCADAPGCYLEVLDKLQKQVYVTAGLSFAPSLEHLYHCWNVVNFPVGKYWSPAIPVDVSFNFHKTLPKHPFDHPCDVSI